MHKKDRPMLSVTSLLHGSPTPTTPTSNTLLFSPNNQNNNNNGGINYRPDSMTSPNGLSMIVNNNNNQNNNNNGAITISGNNSGVTSPIGSMNINNQSIQNSNNVSSPNGGPLSSSSSTCDNRYPPNHPLSGSKHLCAICEDRASGKHYGVYSCEGCKGFFKRTVRKDLTYLCRDEKKCIVDKRQRNRCQYCRYQKCLEMGMKREAVQEERQRNKPEEPESSTNSPTANNNINNQSDISIYYELNIERLTEAERIIEIIPNKCSPNTKIATREIELLFYWVRHIPYFNTLHKEDQLLLLINGWNELLIAEFSYRSTCKNDAILLANGVEVSKQNAQIAGIGDIFGRVLNELVFKMREMQMDQSEIGCLRAIVLFNPAIKNLKSSATVEKLRDRVYSILENHCRNCYQNKTSRFAKLLVRLPALRSIGLKCVEHLFFEQFLQENNRKLTMENFIIQTLNLGSSIRSNHNNNN